VIAAIDAAEARRRAELAAWAAAEKSGAREDLERYLADHPSGSHTGEAKQKLAVLDEASAWSKARRRNNRASYEGYLNTYPKGRYARDARGRIAELQGAEAKAPRVTIVKEAKQTPPPVKPGTPQSASRRWPSADEPFIGADGRIRR
jgi:hypothetical protein